ncbi:uncharacterized protein LOC122266488 [Penaeus japonicus]|uniref:uncharacterized protein LOC122266488 n=1 Tax=Penaeus japonicus TaxID=27405 RepID=UPI001C7168BE|nr:uncharacterized protein LOC122266488 [Penaeus japonicus]
MNMSRARGKLSGRSTKAQDQPIEAETSSMSSKKDLKKEKMQRLKKEILQQLPKDLPMKVTDLITAVGNSCKLDIQQRNTAKQVIELMVRKGLVTLTVSDGEEFIELDDPDQTITERKKRKARAHKGKAKRYRRPRQKADETTTITEASTSHDISQSGEHESS